MTDLEPFERRWAAALDRYADDAPLAIDLDAVATTARMDRRRSWPGMTVRPFGRGIRPAPMAIVFGLLLLAIIATVAIVGGPHLRSDVVRPDPTQALKVTTTDAFVPIPSADERFPAAVAQLADGRVLLIGGQKEGEDIAKRTELFDPATGRFDPSGDLAIGRLSTTATTLRDGRVLVPGGDDGVAAMDRVELYDPATGTFSSAAPMHEPRQGHTATLLSDGRVLVIGGSESGDSAEIYDPTTDSWRVVGHLAVGRMGHVATLLTDGSVLVAGGYGGPTRVTPVAEIFDPGDATFSTTGSMSVGRSQFGAVRLEDGRVLVVGGTTTGPDGHTLDTTLDWVEIYDPRSGRFSPTGSLQEQRAVPVVVGLDDGRVMVVGGGDRTEAEVYDAASGTFSSTGARAQNTHSTFGVVLPDGRVLLPNGTAELFVPKGTVLGSGAVPEQTP